MVELNRKILFNRYVLFLFVLHRFFSFLSLYKKYQCVAGNNYSIFYFSIIANLYFVDTKKNKIVRRYFYYVYTILKNLCISHYLSYYTGFHIIVTLKDITVLNNLPIYFAIFTCRHLMAPMQKLLRLTITSKRRKQYSPWWRNTFFFLVYYLIFYYKKGLSIFFGQFLSRIIRYEKNPRVVMKFFQLLILPLYSSLKNMFTYLSLSFRGKFTSSGRTRFREFVFFPFLHEKQKKYGTYLNKFTYMDYISCQAITKYGTMSILFCLILRSNYLIGNNSTQNNKMLN